MSLRPADTLASIFPLGSSLETGWLITLLSCDTPEKPRGDSQRRPPRDLLAHTRPIKCGQSDNDSCPVVFRGSQAVQFCSPGDECVITALLLQEKPPQRSRGCSQLLEPQSGIWNPKDQAPGTLRARHLGFPSPASPQVLLHLRHHQLRLLSPDRPPAGL